MPWVLLTIFVFAWGLPPVKAALNEATLRWDVPGLHERIIRVAPVVPKPHAEATCDTVPFPPARSSPAARWSRRRRRWSPGVSSIASNSS